MIKIPIQLKKKQVLPKTQTSEPIVMLHPISLHNEQFIDLKTYYMETQTSNQITSKKDLIIKVLTELIENTENNIKNTTGPNNKKDQIRIGRFREAIKSLREFEGEIISGSQAKKLSGIGNGIAQRIDEIIQTGTLSELSIKPEVNIKDLIIKDLMSITGIGHSNAVKFADKGVSGIHDLQQKVEQGLIKVTHHMQIGLKYHNDFQQKIPFQEISELSQKMKTDILKEFPNLLIEVCGSHRRQKQFSGDIDVLITDPMIISELDITNSQISHLKKIVILLKESGFIDSDLTENGCTKYMGVCKHPKYQIGRRIDIRFVPYESFYPALLYFTGSMMTNKLMRTIALSKGYTLNEYGLYHYSNGVKGQKIPTLSEKEIFDHLHIKYLSPKDREI